MTRVLMLLGNGFTHDPRVHAEALSLAAAGYDVTVLAWDRRGALPEEEQANGVRVVRIRNTLGMRLRLFDIFRLKPFWRLATRRALALHAATPFSVVHCHDLDTLPSGVRFKERTNARLVYDAHEIFPYVIELSRARRWTGRFEALERRLVPHADLIVAAGPGQRDYLRPMTEAPIAVVTNSKPLAFSGYEPPTTKRMTVAFYGGLDPVRLLVPLAELAVEDGSFDFEVAGDGSLTEEIRALAARSHGHIRYLGIVPMDEVLSRTRANDVVFSMANPVHRISKIGVPNKFFEALVAGRPILVTRGTWVGSEVEAAQCGLAIDYSKAALHEALKELGQDPALRERLGRNALRLAQDRYNWAREERVLLEAYRGIGVPRGRSAAP